MVQTALTEFLIPLSQPDSSLNLALQELSAVTAVFPEPDPDIYVPLAAEARAGAQVVNRLLGQTVAGTNRKISPYQWSQALNKASLNLFRVSAGIVAQRKNEMELRKRAASILSKRAKREALPLRPALTFLWSLAKYSDEPWLRLFGMENFCSLFMIAMRPFRLGSGRLLFPPPQQIWEEKLASRTITALKQMVADRRIDRKLRGMAQKLLERLKKCTGPKSVLGIHLTAKTKPGLPGIHPREFCLATTGLDLSELKSRKEGENRDLLPLPMDHVFLVYLQFKRRIEYWGKRGTEHREHYKAAFAQVERGHRKGDNREFFIGIFRVLALITNQ